MKVTLQWQKPIMEYDIINDKYYPSKEDRDSIFLEVTVKGLSETESYEYITRLENAINQSNIAYYGKVSFGRCSAYGDVEDGALSDFCGWKRNFGMVKEQKREIMQDVRQICKALSKEY